LLSFAKLDVFFDLPNLQKGLKETKSTFDDGEYSIEIKGNFTWSLGIKKEEEKEEEVKKEGEVKKEEEKKTDEVKPENSEVEKKVEKEVKIKDLLHLKNIDLKIKKGWMVGIVGPTNSGKTSLLRALNGEMIYVSNEDVEIANEQTRNADYFIDLAKKISSKELK
jgi:ABC-type glutathione transport system ATPase component